MSGDPELEELKRDARDAAERERKREDDAAREARERAASQHAAGERRGVAEARRKREGVERVEIWHSLAFPIAHDNAGLPWIFILLALPAIAIEVPNLYVRLIPLGLLALFLGLMLRSYLKFRRWRSALPFTLTGWQALVEGEHPPTRERWQRVKIEVTLPPPKTAPPPPAPAAGDAPYREIHALGADDDRTDFVLAALMVFADRANSDFYASRGEDHKRSKWHASGTSASGSANAYVLWRIYQLCTGPLAMIARKRGAFEVSLTAQGKSEHVSVPSSKR